jgi:hypothetical protein
MSFWDLDLVMGEVLLPLLVDDSKTVMNKKDFIL